MTFVRPVAGRVMRRLLGLALTVVVAAAACKTIREELPTQPESSNPDDALAGGPMIPAAPTPTPTPPPEEQAPLPAPGSGGGGAGGAGGASGSCGEPAPPAISRVNVKIFARQASRVVLDATPLVGPNQGYCEQIGYTDGRSMCPVRPTGHPERTACEALRVGAAADTGRIGPTWSADGRPCQGESGGASCLNHPENQYLVFAYGTGTFRACVVGGACGQAALP